MKLLTAKEAAQYLRISLFTLGRIEKKDLLLPFRTPGGHRRYSLEMLNEYLERSRVRGAKRGKRILLVDDGEEVFELLTRNFSPHQLSRAGDAVGVGMKLAEFKPDLVLVNTGMSGLDGLDLCRRLSGQGTGLKVLPFEVPRDGEGAAKGTVLNPSALGVLQEKIEDLLGEPG